MIVCLCKGVTKEDLDEALSAGDDSLELSDIAWMTDATTGCGSCKPYVQQMIEKWLESEKNKKNRKSRRSTK